jgi:hypothetical protein
MSICKEYSSEYYKTICIANQTILPKSKFIFVFLLFPSSF